MSKFKKFWMSLTKTEKTAYAKEVNTSVDYIDKHYMRQEECKRKIPRKKRIVALAEASKLKVLIKAGRLSLGEHDIVKHFF